MATIRSFTREESESARLEKLSDAYQQTNAEAIRISSAFIPLIRMAILVGFLATLVVGGFKTFSGELEVSAYSVLIFLTQRLLWPFTKLGITVDLFARSMASTERILNLLGAPYHIANPKTAKPLKEVKGAIEFRELDFKYATGSQLFDKLNLQLQPNTMTALVGPTGSGKTTLVKILLRFLDPSGGSVRLDGFDLRDLDLKTLRSNMALVSQDIFLFQGTVRENIAFGLPNATEAMIVAAAKGSEAHDFVSALPQGYDTVIGERGMRLSGGQRQRLSHRQSYSQKRPHSHIR